MRRFILSALALAGLLAAPAMAADPAPFDLTGPAMSITVTRGGQTLPIGEVPQLAAGDRIDVAADLPRDQSAHYLLIAAFLRGSTNPPPDKWFTQYETWQPPKKGAPAGLSLTVPDGAEQVALFLAPETGGDFSTLRNAVQGKPGAFVRAAQDLAQASLDRARLDTYLAAVRRTVPGDPDRLTRITPLLARSLQVKINADCLARMPSLQAACLLQNQESLVLDDGHSNAITEALAGPGSDLALQLAATPQGGLGYYSPYIAAIRDIIGIFSSIHTAKYQYIPAIGTLAGDRMQLLLNAPPSFHNPKSVLVTALPIVAPVHVPPLQVPDASPTLCLQADAPLLPMAGAPLIYATRYAHDLVLRVTLPGGHTVDLPAEPDAEQGGLVVRIKGQLPADAKGPLDARVHGVWGFQPFDGPAVRLVGAVPGQWRLSADANPAPGATVTLTGGAAACVASVDAQLGGGAPAAATWKKTGPDAIDVTLPKGDAKGTIAVSITGPAGTSPDRLTLAAPKPQVRIGANVIAHDVQPATPAAPIAIVVSDGLVPAGGGLTVSLRTDKDAKLTGQETVELQAASGGSTARLTSANGGLTFVDDHVLIARLKPAEALGPSAFGALRARIVRDGGASDWLPVGTLARLPTIRALQCPPDAAAPCTMAGDGLFLIDAISATPGFEQPAKVPEGYAAPSIQVPHPPAGGLYLRLHDAPDVVNRIGG